MLTYVCNARARVCVCVCMCLHETLIILQSIQAVAVMMKNMMLGNLNQITEQEINRLDS